MPEIGEQIYSSQQICIPPTFPYLLRQFAKAAIRTQPNDLLKWSTTYFRCLSLNIPPPVKPRLEYPIPKDHHGMTPGWLRALLHQMTGSKTVTFKVLWDRWIGACLHHHNLIQILVLGGFEDNTAVPWLRFIGLCAAHLTENLTQSMILICEILTEEPEGGSAMIPLEIFVDLYQFLANINASVGQTLRNYYFLDKFLELYQEKIAKDSGVKPQEEETEEVLTLLSSESTAKSEKETGKEDDTSVISCPSVISQEEDNYLKLLMKMREAGEDEYYGEEEEAKEVKEEVKKEEPPPVVEEPPAEPAEDEGSTGKPTDEEEGEEEDEDAKVEMKPFTQQLEEDKDMDLFPAAPDDAISQDTKDSLLGGSDDFSEKLELPKPEEDPYLMEDLERLRAVHQELMGESDDEMEKFKASILADAGLTPSQTAAPQDFETKIEEQESSTETPKTEPSVASTAVTEKEKEPVDEREYEDVYVDAVPGIGPQVPKEMVAAVVNYLKGVALVQHGMVMPRNVKHYECPPLEVYR